MNAPERSIATAGGWLPTAAGASTIRLFGKVDADMLRSFFEQRDALRDAPGPLVIDLATEGGDADIGRRLALEVRLLREARRSRGEDDGRLCFFGKSVVYSAGVTLMSAFPVADRWLAAGTSLLIHERKLDKTVHLSGPLRAVVSVVRDLLAEIENGQKLEGYGFADLVRGSDIGLDELMRHVGTANWYLSAEEALARGLIAGVL